MTKEKLTLTASPEVILMAKEQAKQKKTSVSTMFSNFILERNKHKMKRPAKKEFNTPITDAISGIIKLPDHFNEKNFMSSVMCEKYRIGK